MGKWIKAASANVMRYFEQDTAPTTLDGITLADLWTDTSGTPTVKVCTNVSPVTFVSVGGGGGSSAPTDAQYVVLAANGTLTNESVLAVGSTNLSLTGATLDVNTTALATALNLSGTNTGDQTITLTGDITGTGTGSFATTLATVNSNIGSYNTVTVNAKGLVTAASNTSYLTDNQTITLSGDVTGSGTTAITGTLATVNSNVGTFTNATVTVNAKGLVTAVSTGTGGSFDYGKAYIIARGIF